MDTPRILRIKGKNDEKPDKYCVKFKLRRDLTSQKSDVYELKMTLFDNRNPEELLLFIINFNMNIDASGKLVASKNIQYLCMLINEEDLCQFDTLSAEVGSNTTENLKSIILGFGKKKLLLLRC